MQKRTNLDQKDNFPSFATTSTKQTEPLQQNQECLKIMYQRATRIGRELEGKDVVKR